MYSEDGLVDFKNLNRGKKWSAVLYPCLASANFIMDPGIFKLSRCFELIFLLRAGSGVGMTIRRKRAQPYRSDYPPPFTYFPFGFSK